MDSFNELNYKPKNKDYTNNLPNIILKKLK